MHIFVESLSRVELFLFASLLMESMQYQNRKPMFGGYANHGAKTSHSVFYSQKTQSLREPGELESVYGPEALALSTLKEWRKRFQERRTELMDDPMSE
jgi:hypothetical protein